MLESQLDSLNVLLPLSFSNNSAVLVYLAGCPATSGEVGHKGRVSSPATHMSRPRVQHSTPADTLVALYADLFIYLFIY